MKDKQYDVVVAGGGTAGVLAALASAKSGAKTLLIEQSGALGGVASTGMPWGGLFDNNHKQVVFGLADKLVKKAVDLGALGYIHYNSDDGHNWISALACIDSEIARYLFRKELAEICCDVMLYSMVYAVKKEEDCITELKICTRGGTVEVLGKAFVDCTGDAVLAHLGGVPWERGEGENQQCVSSLIRISNIDLNAFRNYMNNVINDSGWYPWDYLDGPTRGGFTYWCPWKNDLGLFTYPPKQLGLIWSGFEGDVYLNCTNADADVLNPLSLSEGDYHIREQAREIASYFVQKVPGFKNSFLSHVYDMGIRESRRIKGAYCVTKEDLLTRQHFEDVIGLGAYPLDHHMRGGTVKILTHEQLKSSNMESSYEIPYRCMINEAVKNLVVAGRCISATFEAQAALRGIGPCMVEGEAAGCAAALSVTMGSTLFDLKIPALQQVLRQNHVFERQEG